MPELGIIDVIIADENFQFMLPPRSMAAFAFPLTVAVEFRKEQFIADGVTLEYAEEFHA